MCWCSYSYAGSPAWLQKVKNLGFISPNVRISVRVIQSPWGLLQHRDVLCMDTAFCSLSPVLPTANLLCPAPLPILSPTQLSPFQSKHAGVYTVSETQCTPVDRCSFRTPSRWTQGFYPTNLKCWGSNERNTCESPYKVHGSFLFLGARCDVSTLHK